MPPPVWPSRPAGGPYERLYTEFVDPDRGRILEVQNRMLEARSVEPDSLEAMLPPFLERPGYREPAWALLGLRLLREDIEGGAEGPVQTALSEVVKDMRRHGSARRRSGWSGPTGP